MAVAELAEAFDMDVSTIHRQTTAAMKAGLLERIPDPDGGIARKLRPTEEGVRRLTAELDARKRGFARILDDWTDDEVSDFVDYLRRYNEAVEARRGKRWPRDSARPLRRLRVPPPTPCASRTRSRPPRTRRRSSRGPRTACARTLCGRRAGCRR